VGREGKSLLWLVASLPRLVVLSAIRAYQLFISPLLPSSCRFYPSCSAYAIEAVKLHGTGRGLILALLRLLRCNPLFSGGYDAVVLQARWWLVSERYGFHQRRSSEGESGRG